MSKLSNRRHRLDSVFLLLGSFVQPWALVNPMFLESDLSHHIPCADTICPFIVYFFALSAECLTISRQSWARALHLILRYFPTATFNFVERKISASDDKSKMTKMIWRAQVKGCLDWSGSTVHSALRKIRLYSYICSFNVIKYPIDIQFALQMPRESH